MSTKTVQQFWQKAQQDASLKNKLAAIQEKERQATIVAIIKLAAEAGFAFTAQEYEAAIKEEMARQHAAGELDDKQLSDVAAGAPPSSGNVGTIRW